jgi:hypothetical protein
MKKIVYNSGNINFSSILKVLLKTMILINDILIKKVMIVPDHFNFVINYVLTIITQVFIW